MAKKQAFKNSDAQYAKAFNAGNAAGVAALYTKDALYMGPEAPPVKGRKALQAAAQAAIDAGWRDIKFKTIRTGVDGDMAFSIGSVSMTQGATKVKGKYQDVYKRQADGSWKVASTMYNLDKPAK